MTMLPMHADRPWQPSRQFGRPCKSQDRSSRSTGQRDGAARSDMAGRRRCRAQGTRSERAHDLRPHVFTLNTMRPRGRRHARPGPAGHARGFSVMNGASGLWWPKEGAAYDGCEPCRTHRVGEL